MHGAKTGTLVAVEGPSGVGKTTLARAAARTFGWVLLAEAFDRLDPAPSLEFDSPRDLVLLEATLLAEESRRYLEARQRCAVGRTVIADTGFFGPVTYTRGLAALGRVPEGAARTIERSARPLLRNGGLGIPDLTVYLTLPETERRRRAEHDRAHHPTALDPRHRAVGEVERQWFERSFPAALPARFRTLRAGPGVPVLVAALRTLVAHAEPAPAVQKEGLELLAALRRPGTGRRGRNAAPNR